MSSSIGSDVVRTVINHQDFNQGDDGPLIAWRLPGGFFVEKIDVTVSALGSSSHVHTVGFDLRFGPSDPANVTEFQRLDHCLFRSSRSIAGQPQVVIVGNGSRSLVWNIGQPVPNDERYLCLWCNYNELDRMDIIASLGGFMPVESSGVRKGGIGRKSRSGRKRKYEPSARTCGKCAKRASKSDFPKSVSRANLARAF